MFEAAPFTRLKELKHLRDTGQIDRSCAGPRWSRSRRGRPRQRAGLQKDPRQTMGGTRFSPEPVPVCRRGVSYRVWLIDAPPDGENHTLRTRAQGVKPL